MASPFRTRLGRLIVSARAAMAWERLWPAAAPMVGVAILFIASAWMGLWVGLPAMAKVAGLAMFAALFVLAGWRLVALTMPGRAEAMRRLEADAALDHQPLDAYEDALAPGADDFAARLWQVHRARAEARLSALRVPVPRADLVPHDPYALRSAVGIVAFIGLVVGAGALAERIITPFDFTEPTELATGPQFRLDAWVTPPAYTGRAPLFLSSATRVETDDGIHVPAGSILTVRSQGAAGVELFVSSSQEVGSRAMEALSGDGATAAHAQQGDVVIDGSMAVEVRRDGETIDGWEFRATADAAPTVGFTEAPSGAQGDTFELRYELDDDYGIASAQAVVRPLDAAPSRRPLVEDPTFALTLPGGAGMRGAARTVHDLTAHPYAGQEVEITLSATDGHGQVGHSEGEVFRLPARPFTNPVARAVLEQRAALAMDAEAHGRVIDAVDLILLDPETLGDAGAYLSATYAYRELVHAEGDDELREMLGVLWELALLLEDDGLSDAERALRAAQERLRQALEDGADEEEIARLTQELRQAMQDYMRALAQNMQDAPQGEVDPNAQMLTQQDLDDMLRRIEELARQGRHAEAEALLAEMQQMMQNLQMAQRGQGQGQGQGQGEMGQEGQTLEELGQMIQRQQELMDETYGMNQGQPGSGQPGSQVQPGQPGSPNSPFGPYGQPPSGQSPFGQPSPFGPFGQSPFGQQGQPGQPGQQGQPGAGPQQDGMTPQERAEALQRLQREQAELQRQLGELMDRLGEQGFEPGERMGDAQRSMGDAGEALGQDRAGDAVGEQSDALQALREGAQQMAQQLAEAQQQGGPGGEELGEGAPGPGRDPLGRTRREGSYADTSRVGVPDEIDSQAARRILQELRERLGDMTLPRLERDYLERLLP
ncbi:TIGR02302 family protein [Acuticoccus sp.]|uniref:TIGR02302 family protein n=1 Tax=Acuticoccus sp. TaxID=1904378 RepID=UPI003B519C46